MWIYIFNVFQTKDLSYRAYHIEKEGNSMIFNHVTINVYLSKRIHIPTYTIHEEDNA